MTREKRERLRRWIGASLIGLVLLIGGLFLAKDRIGFRQFYTDGRTVVGEDEWTSAARTVWADRGAVFQSLENHSDRAPTIAPGAGDVYFSRKSENGDWDLFRSRWSPEGYLEPEPLFFLNSPADETDPFVTDRGQTLLFSSNRPGGVGGYDLYAARISGGEIPSPTILGRPINSDGDETHPSSDRDGRRLVFASNRLSADSSRTEIFEAEKTSDSWSAPQLIAATAVLDSDVRSPALSPDGGMLFFAADPGDSRGGYDLYRSVRFGADWREPESIRELNTADDEVDPSFSNEGRYVVFARSVKATDVGSKFRLIGAERRDLFLLRESREGFWTRLLWVLLAILGALLASWAYLKWRRLHPFVKFVILSILAHLLFLLWIESRKGNDLPTSDTLGDGGFSLTFLSGGESGGGGDLSGATEKATGDAVTAAAVSFRAEGARVDRSSEQSAPEAIAAEGESISERAVETPSAASAADRAAVRQATADVAMVAPSNAATEERSRSGDRAAVAVLTGASAVSPIDASETSDSTSGSRATTADAMSTPETSGPTVGGTASLRETGRGALTELASEMSAASANDRGRSVAAPTPVASSRGAGESDARKGGIDPKIAEAGEKSARAVAANRPTGAATTGEAATFSGGESAAHRAGSDNAPSLLENRGSAHAPLVGETADSGGTAERRSTEIPSIAGTKAGSESGAEKASGKDVVARGGVRGPDVAATTTGVVESAISSGGRGKTDASETSSRAGGDGAPSILARRAATGSILSEDESAAPSRRRAVPSGTLERGSSGVAEAGRADGRDEAVAAAGPNGPRDLSSGERADRPIDGVIGRRTDSESGGATAGGDAPTALLGRRGTALSSADTAEDAGFARRGKRGAPTLASASSARSDEAHGRDGAGESTTADAPGKRGRGSPVARSFASDSIGNSPTAFAPIFGGRGAAILGDVVPADLYPAAFLTRRPFRWGEDHGKAEPPRTLYANRVGPTKLDALKAGGGSEETEAAVLSGLRYLAKRQRDDGGWGRTVRHEKYEDVRIGKSGLALLAFLGSGYTQKDDNEFRDVVARGFAYLIAEQDRSGHIGDSESYGHGIATYALAEAYAMTKDETLAEPLKKAVRRIIRAQSKDRDPNLAGGWSYYYRDPMRRYDRWPRLSITVWQIMALESARLGGIDVPESVLESAKNFVLASYDEELRAFRYNHDPSWLNGPYPTLPGSTTAGLFAMQILGVPDDDPRVLAAVDFASSRLPTWKWQRPADSRFVRDGWGNLYFGYYATLGLFRRGGDAWNAWNTAMTKLLLSSQAKDGSWRPISPYDEYADDSDNDRCYTTSLAVLMLEVYYRYFTPLLSHVASGAARNVEKDDPTAAVDQKIFVVVREVVADTSADRLGLEVGDVLLSVAGKEVSAIAELRPVFSALKAGTVTTLKIRRGNDEFELELRGKLTGVTFAEE